MIYILGIDINDRSDPKAKSLRKELANAKFKLSELKVVKENDKLPGEGYALLFGGEPVRALLDSSVTDVRGTVCVPAGQSSLLCFPCWSPGYVFRRPNRIHLFRDDLKNAKFWIDVDRGTARLSE